MSSYRPLPCYLTIAESKIEGLGLYTKQNIQAAAYVGVTHIYYREDWVRTPLGGFINHSANPNAVIIMCDTRHERKLYTIRPIEAGGEISIYYTLYYPYLKEPE